MRGAETQKEREIEHNESAHIAACHSIPTHCHSSSRKLHFARGECAQRMEASDSCRRRYSEKKTLRATARVHSHCIPCFVPSLSWSTSCGSLEASPAAAPQGSDGRAHQSLQPPGSTDNPPAGGAPPPHLRWPSSGGFFFPMASTAALRAVRGGGNLKNKNPRQRYLKISSRAYTQYA